MLSLIIVSMILTQDTAALVSWSVGTLHGKSDPCLVIWGRKRILARSQKMRSLDSSSKGSSEERDPGLKELSLMPICYRLGKCSEGNRQERHRKRISFSFTSSLFGLAVELFRDSFFFAPVGWVVLFLVIKGSNPLNSGSCASIWLKV